jgi:uncharacterized protein
MSMLFFGPFMFYWWSAGMMLLGMAAMKAKLITGAQPAKVYAAMAAIGFGLGLPMASVITGLKLAMASSSDVEAMLLFVAHYLPTVFVVTGWVGLVLLICRAHVLARFLHPLGCVGRMALTNYLSQTLIVTFVFYGHGLGYFAMLDRPKMALIVLGVWLLQLVWSPIWLARFRFGPLEWLWRSLTYGRLEPLKKK